MTQISKELFFCFIFGLKICFGSNVVKFSLLFTRNYRKNRFLRWSMCPWDTLLTCYHLFLEDMTLHLNIIYLKIQLFSYGEKNTCVDITFAYTGIRKVGGEPSNFFFKYKLNAIKALKLKVVSRFSRDTAIYRKSKHASQLRQPTENYLVLGRLKTLRLH